ncbi:MAG: hypothetical protein SV375_15025 [Thermodesulfobacteriota bacterium]|nr:hypothetical protein [Thermodesulfobacteriota bacterium]
MDPQLPLISYLFLEAAPDQEKLRNVMATQSSHPFLWTNLIKKRLNSTPIFTAVGPGAVISRTVRWIDRDIGIANAGTKEKWLKTVGKFKTFL